MDRNLYLSSFVLASLVALRKESVDRNSSGAKADSVSKVALRKESVDRNLYYGDDLTFSDGSLSARRAWIEITAHTAKKTSIAGSLSARRAWIEMRPPCCRQQTHMVALRKESVDRNDDLKVPAGVSKESLSARRAWIEIPRFWRQGPAPLVALRKESVDRNQNSRRVRSVGGTSLSARRAWIEI